MFFILSLHNHHFLSIFSVYSIMVFTMQLFYNFDIKFLFKGNLASRYFKLIIIHMFPSGIICALSLGLLSLGKTEIEALFNITDSHFDIEDYFIIKTMLSVNIIILTPYLIKLFQFNYKHLIKLEKKHKKLLRTRYSLMALVSDECLFFLF